MNEKKKKVVTVKKLIAFNCLVVTKLVANLEGESFDAASEEAIDKVQDAASEVQ